MCVGGGGGERETDTDSFLISVGFTEYVSMGCY